MKSERVGRGNEGLYSGWVPDLKGVGFMNLVRSEVVLMLVCIFFIF